MAWVYTIGSLSLLSVPAIWAYQIYHWLKWGDWLGISLSDGLNWLGLSAPQFTWAGVQKVSDLLMTLPFSLAILLLIIGILAALSQWADSQSDNPS